MPDAFPLVQSAPMPESTTKICIKCGRDCSAVPRLRSATGQYACKSCVAAESGLPATPHDMSGRSRAPCPKCGSDRSVGTLACAVCGHSEGIDPGCPKLPKVKKPKRGKPLLCRKCQYDLTGLRDGLCPECGHINSIAGKRDWDEENSKEVARNAYLKPLIYLAVGMALVLGTYAARGAPLGFLGYLIMFPILVTIAYVMLWLCCMMWLGFTSSPLLMLVQLAGIHGAVGGVAALLSFIPFIGMAGFIPIILCGAVYVRLMSDWMDMEAADAKIVAVIVYVAIMGISIFAVVQGWL